MNLAVTESEIEPLKDEPELADYLYAREPEWLDAYNFLPDEQRAIAFKQLIRNVNASRALAIPPIELYESIDEILGTEVMTALTEEEPTETVSPQWESPGIDSAAIEDIAEEISNRTYVWSELAKLGVRFQDRSNPEILQAIDRGEAKRIAKWVPIIRERVSNGFGWHEIADEFELSTATIMNLVKKYPVLREAYEEALPERSALPPAPKVTKAKPTRVDNQIPENILPASNIPASKELEILPETFQYMITVNREQQRHLIALAYWSGDCSVEDIITEAIRSHLEMNGDWQSTDRFGEVKDALKEVIQTSEWYETYHKFPIDKSNLLKFLLNKVETWENSDTIQKLRISLGLYLAKTVVGQITSHESTN
jgi:hypothetical protein